MSVIFHQWNMSIIETKFAKLQNPETGALAVLNGDIHDPQIQALAKRFDMVLLEVESENGTGDFYLPGKLPQFQESYDLLRQREYPPLAEQLDMLYHDINQGKLGETAKDSSFYLALKQVKETYPKEEPIGV